MLFINIGGRILPPQTCYSAYLRFYHENSSRKYGRGEGFYKNILEGKVFPPQTYFIASPHHIHHIRKIGRKKKKDKGWRERFSLLKLKGYSAI